MLDEFDIESYKPKPINAGLGFGDKEPIRQKSPRSTLERRLERENTTGVDSLKAFYDMPVTGAITSPEKVMFPEREAEASLQFFGWLLDLLFVGIIASASIVGLGLFAHFFERTSMEMVVLTFSQMDGIMGMGVLFAITYLLYFTYGDIGTSFGKKLLGVKLVAKSNRTLNSKMTFVRSLTTLLSLCLLGVPALLDFQGKLSDTKIVRD